jgi:putative ABC transport system permease protein
VTTDLREVYRFWRRNPLLSLSGFLIVSVEIAVSSLALGALWTLSHPSLPGIRAGSFVTVGAESHQAPLSPISWQTVNRIKENLPSYVIGVYGDSVTALVNNGERRIPIHLAVCSGNLFTDFALPLIAGSSFSAATEAKGLSKSIILSSAVARELFESPTSAVGQSVHVNGVSVQVIGVAAPKFDGLFGQKADAWIPPGLIVPLYFDFNHQADDDEVAQRAPVLYSLVALNRGNAEGAANQIQLRLTEVTRTGPKLAVVPGIDHDPSGRASSRAWAGLALCIAIFLTTASALSFGGMLLARAPRNAGQVRLKRALGATSARLCLDLVVGPASIVVLGFLSGFAMSVIATHVNSLRWGDLDLAIPLSPLQLSLLALAQVPSAMLVAILTALAPAVVLVQQESGAPRPWYTASGSKSSSNTLQSIVAGQIICCICASILAGAVARSVTVLMSRPLGYEPSRTVLAIGMKSMGTYRTSSNGGSPLAKAFDRVLLHVQQLPGIRNAALATAAPLEPTAKSMILSSMSPTTNSVSVACNGVSREYLKSLGTQIVSGRNLSVDLLAGDPQEALVNDTLRKQIWPLGDPVGKVIRLEHPEMHFSFEAVVVGVAHDQRMSGPKEPARPTVYLPLSGNVFAGSLPMFMIVDGNVPLFRLVASTDSEFASVFPSLGVIRSYRIDNRLEGILGEIRRRALFALAGAAAIAIIAYVGLYSSILYFISVRRRELAIRICCGATSAQISWIVMGRALRSGVWACGISIMCFPLLRILVIEWISVQWSSLIAAFATALCLLAVAATAIGPALTAGRMMPASAIREDN